MSSFAAVNVRAICWPEAGTSAIELYYTDSVTIQKNETYGTIKKAGGADSNGIDTDKATTKSIIQYNYIDDNLAAGSPAMKAAAIMPNNGGQDFFGTALPASAADLGAQQSP